MKKMKEQKQSYYDESKEGWYWYKWFEEEEQREKFERPSLMYSRDELWKMDVDEFSKLLEETKKEAVRDPVPEKVYEYYYLQDIARRKALAFANTSAYVLQKHPELDVKRDNPVAVPGRTALSIMREQEISEKIRQSRDDFALVYFYSPSCPFCEAQEGILKYFVEKYRWEIKRVNIDVEKKAALRFGIERVPVILLVYRESGQWLVVGNGVVSLDELEANLYRGMLILKGEREAAEFATFEYEKGGPFDVR